MLSEPQTPALSDEMKRHMIEHGYVRVPGAVPYEDIEKVRRAIHVDIGAKGIDPEQLPRYRTRTFCPDLTRTPAVMNLLTQTPILPLAESLLGEGGVQVPASGQIALRFPQDVEDEQAARKPHGGHIDGVPSKANDVPKDKLNHFTMLIGVLLSDVPEEWSGNFTVYPGSHQRMSDYFQDHSPLDMIDGRIPVDFGTPKQICGKAGDVIFAHYLTAHGATVNLASEIRYASFFRIFQKNHPMWTYRFEAIRDPWLDWEGLHPLLDRP